MGPRRQPKPDPKAEATSEPLKATPQTQKSSTLNSVPSAKLPQSDSANTAAEGANSVSALEQDPAESVLTWIRLSLVNPGMGEHGHEKQLLLLR